MICIISPSHRQASNWANTQNLASTEWFYGYEETIRIHKSFHVIVVGEFPEERLGWFEKIYHMARTYGSRK